MTSNVNQAVEYIVCDILQSKQHAQQLNSTVTHVNIQTKLHYEVSKATPANQMAPIHPERRHLRGNWPSIHLRYHQSPA